MSQISSLKGSGHRSCKDMINSIGEIPCMILVILFTLHLSGCGSGGGKGDEPPAFLRIEPDTLKFGAEDEIKTILVENAGGRPFTFEVVEMLDWLDINPRKGLVDGGASTTLVVRVLRDALVHDTQNGEFTVQTDVAGAKKVQVSVEKGKPVLEITFPEGLDHLEFYKNKLKRTVTLKNVGNAKLTLSFTLLGEEWVSWDAPATATLNVDGSMNVTFQVIWEKVPWYGDDTREVAIITPISAGNPVRIKARVVVESSCEVDEECGKPGSYCDKEKGQCASKKLNGQKCKLDSECQSGECVDGICCENACEGQCMTCNDTQKPGKCVPVADGSECDDGKHCTVDDRCQKGECIGGSARDCSGFDTECGKGQCSEEKGGCYTDAPDDVCVIDGICYKDGDFHPDPMLICLRCDPSQDKTKFSVEGGWCLIGGVCYEGGQKVGECEVCDAYKNPYVASKAVDGTGCSADADPCTEDICKGGLCIHEKKDTGQCDDGNPCTKDDKCVGGKCKGTLYSCDDGLSCTDDSCVGDGGCEHKIKAGYCLIDGVCVEAGEVKEGSHGCARCKPLKSQYGWSLEDEGTPCEDMDPCTEGDKCMGGVCVGKGKSCDDGLVCTKDYCDPTGKCKNERLADWCIIGGKCYQADISPQGKDSQCLVCDPYKSPEQWMPKNEGLLCDDQNPCTEKSVCASGKCVAVGTECDDGIGCTEDICKDGECKHAVMAGKCLIGGVCYEGNAMKPDSQCLACKPLISQVSWTPVNEGKGCDDGFYCTIGDKCQSGECKGEPLVCDAGVCQDAWCSEEKHACVTVWEDDGVPCDDNDLCTIGDQCESGKCIGVAKDCSSVGEGNQCVKGVCDPKDGQCKAVPVGEGQDCDDGQWCTLNDKCKQGKCLGQARDCSDPCNTGTCDEDNDQCVKTPANEGNACNDNDFCTTGEKCKSGECMGGQLTDCSNLNDACNIGVCSKAKQACVKQPKADGTDCLSSPPPAHWLSAECQGGKCVATSCEWPYANCGVVTDCSINLKTDKNHCGDCAITCEGSCVDGECSTAIECPPGFGDCDGNSGNGCESMLSSDKNNCGTCGNKCTVVHGGGACAAGNCKVLYCDPGWKDANGEYEDGCEACDPLVDGSFEIPDDGDDNDCKGGDSVNDESRGYYVDGSFVFNATCQDPGKGTRSCPFKDLLMALYTAQFEQDWTNPLLVKREIYIAKGEYIDSGVVADISKPLILVGGYQRTDNGPWTRDIVANKTILRSTGGIAVVAGPDIDGWAVLDGLTITPQVNTNGKLVMRRITSSDQHPLKLAGNGILMMLESIVVGDVAGKDGWVLIGNRFEGNLSGSHSFTLIKNTIYGEVKGNCCWNVISNDIQGNINGGQASWKLTNNTIRGNVSGSFSWTLMNNTIQGNVSGSFSCTLINNSIQGKVSGSKSCTITNSTIRVPPGTSEPAIKMGDGDWSLVNNTIIWQGNPGTHYAIREDSTNADPKVVRNNAFIGFGPDSQGVYYLNEGTTPLTKILQVNMMSDLPSCGRGGNIAIDNIEDAKFLSLDPNSPLFLVPAPDSPLINAGLSLPYTCEDVTIKNPGQDIAGNPRPCGAGFDIGAYEYCPQ